MDSISTEGLKERAYGHPELWECSLDEMINKVVLVLQTHWVKNKLNKKVVKLAADFIRIKFDRKELKGTIEYEVANAIQEALIYYVNCEGDTSVVQGNVIMIDVK